MSQRIADDGRRAWRLSAELEALAVIAQGGTPDPLDHDAWAALYDGLTTPANNSDPVIRAGDLRVTGVALARCRATGHCKAIVGLVDAIDARDRRAGVIYVFMSSHHMAGAQRTVPVILGAPGGDGRLPVPCPPTVATSCRAHGLLEVQTSALLRESRKTIAALDAGKRLRGSAKAHEGVTQPSVSARPFRGAVR